MAGSAMCRRGCQAVVNSGASGRKSQRSGRDQSAAEMGALPIHVTWYSTRFSSICKTQRSVPIWKLN
ncbi:unnamed protein product [Staurois parvus]|uniref:Uncharacterized protein n=1 Tax=Staurois parvus TaxID=386267 RepID=A0ABN9CAK3_9NEOB|nr:unnamed protein product [Staurois parvus]